MPNITPKYNSSQALLGGWPFSASAGDGNLGNRAGAEIDAREPSVSQESVSSEKGKAASRLSKAQARVNSSGRLS